MASRRVTLGIQGGTEYVPYASSEEKLISHLKNQHSLLFTLGDYLTKYAKVFDEIGVHLDVKFPNGTLMRLVGGKNQPTDVRVQSYSMYGLARNKEEEFSYPYQVFSFAFMTREPEHKPQMFGILRAFSLSTWISILLPFITLLFVCHIAFRRKCSPARNPLPISAVFLRQNAVLKPSSLTEKWLLSTWMIGTLFLCLAYRSQILAFLAVPSLSQIKHVPQLARAVERGEYHCIANPSIFWELLQSKQKDIRIIVEDIQKNKLSESVEEVYTDLFRKEEKKNLALIADTDVVELLAVGGDFVSDDRFLEHMAAMTVRKDFCCKRLLETFVHRMMSSGLYFKYYNDATFKSKFPLLLNYSKRGVSVRKLTLTDVAPAFMCLLTGYSVSFLVLVAEILLDRQRKRRKKKKRNMKVKARIEDSP